MKKKPLPFIAGVVLLAVAAFLVWQGLEPTGPITNPVEGSANTLRGSVSKTVGTPTIVAEPGRNEDDSNKDREIEKPLYQLAQTTSSFDPDADAKRKESLPFKFSGTGAGSDGKIVDAKGNVIMTTEPENKVYMFGIEVSPDSKRIAVHKGSGKYDVFDPSTGENVRLPQVPPGENVLAFSWRWLDDQTLVGVSGKTIPFRDDQVGPAREEPIISRTVLYVYDLKERKLSEVELPPAFRTKTVSISAVDATGKVQLRPEGREVSFTDASLGWFEVRPRK